MMLEQVFKTAAGADKRAAFENAHSNEYHYRAIRYRDYERDLEPFNRVWFTRYTWRLERIPKLPNPFISV